MKPQNFTDETWDLHGRVRFFALGFDRATRGASVFDASHPQAPPKLRLQFVTTQNTVRPFLTDGERIHPAS